MRLIINLILVAIIAALGYTLFFGIQKPIDFKDVSTKRLNAVTDRLKQVRYAQEFHRDITGNFAKSFDSLKYVLMTDSFTLVKIEGDPDDPNSDAFVRTIKKRSAYDSIEYLNSIPESKIKINLDSLPYVPYSGGQKFFIFADTLTYQKTLVNVTEVGTQWKTFMGDKYGIDYKRYDKNYNPNNVIKFGDRFAPNISGNWE